MVCMSMTSGYTSDTPASASAPSQPTNIASMVVTTAWSTMTRTLGAASRSRGGATGASGGRRVRAFMDEETTAVEREDAAEAGADAIEVMTCKIIVTCFFVKTSDHFRLSRRF